MLVFIVPVKSEKVSADWNTFCKLFERSIKSICQQKDSEFEVVVVCHEIPSIHFKHPKIHYVTANFPPPLLAGNEEAEKIGKREIDKGKKILLGVEHSKQFNPSHIMVVDSDDCISNKIAGFIKKSDKTIPGWYMEKGYVYREGDHYICLNRSYFNMLCGTSVIIKPEFIKDMFRKEPYLYFDHALKKLPNNIKFIPFPFAAAIYSMGNGENHYMSTAKVKSLNDHSNIFNFNELVRLYKKLNTYRFRLVTSGFKNRFNLHKIE
ncbi:galactosyl transferase [Flaviramulus aquimarinus]|uniref:Galactosyl transferase n=1 Tax=Flaviramulus aquimarinus TaxID=1170456 RepID=A0ABP9ERM0_9FLAO